MIGEKLEIKQITTDRAKEICEFLTGSIVPRFTMSIAGESGSGKTTLAVEIARLLTEKGIKTGILQQDDYFVFPPKTNHENRRQNIEQVGLSEVKLDFLDSNLRSFKRNESLIFKPLVIFDENRIMTEELDTESFEVLIAEGTYTSLLQFVDFRIFIDRDYHQTYEARLRRARDKFEPFMQDVLEIEHQIIKKHKSLANAIISTDFSDVHYRS